ncbi:MAG: L-seryl-tRNA(Sec) selenium transferase, partial [Armatimonadia bacterium]|nr:L-seryl-tRNA(Sec) selenium transferase [Armatimonadia bacterium]
MDQSPLRQLPSVNEVLDTEPGRRMQESYRRPFVLRAVRAALDGSREALLAERPAPTSPDELASRATATLDDLAAAGPRRAINATGVILHTGLGRAPLPAAWLQTAYCDVEVDRESGER